MLERYKKEVAEAEGRRLQAEARLNNATQRWDYQKAHFFRNPVNLFLPFTAGALLATRGSATRQLVGWGNILTKAGKFVLAIYPFIGSARKIANKPSTRNVIDNVAKKPGPPV